jgi:hypothetical protein
VVVFLTNSSMELRHEHYLCSTTKTLESGQQALDLKIEAVHAYQKQAHGEIMEHLTESNEVNGQVQQHLEQELDRIKKHVGLPPVK